MRKSMRPSLGQVSLLIRHRLLPRHWLRYWSLGDPVWRRLWGLPLLSSRLDGREQTLARVHLELQQVGQPEPDFIFAGNPIPSALIILTLSSRSMISFQNVHKPDL